MVNTIDYLITFEADNQVVISGTLRLEHVSDYDVIFQKIKDNILTTNDKFTINISKLIYLNSAGITSIAKLLIISKSHNKFIHVIGDTTIPWQSKFLKSIRMISSNFSTES